MGLFSVLAVAGASGWFFPTQYVPASSFEAGGSTTGFACQLGIVVGLVVEGRGGSQDAGFGAGGVPISIVPCLVLGWWLVWGGCWVGYWMWLAGGFGAGGGVIVRTCRSVQSF